MINYQHLYYFRTVAALGGITAAAQRLRLTPPTLSAQIKALEDALGVQLFDRSSKGMKVTAQGRVALRYADRIFALGLELERALGAASADTLLRVGVETSIVVSTVQPLLRKLMAGGARVACTFATQEELVAALRSNDLDVVLSRTPEPTLDLDHRLILDTDIAFFGNRETAARLAPGFPRSLDGVSFIAPLQGPLRQSVDRWLARHSLALLTNIEIADTSLTAALASDGVGVQSRRAHPAGNFRAETDRRNC